MDVNKHEADWLVVVRELEVSERLADKDFVDVDEILLDSVSVPEGATVDICDSEGVLDGEALDARLADCV
jgi:hypothetical protein